MSVKLVLEFNEEEMEEIKEMANREGKSVEQSSKEAILDKVNDMYEAEFMYAQRKEFLRKYMTDGKTIGKGEQW